MSKLGGILVRLDETPFGEVYRVVLGFSILSLHRLVDQDGRSSWVLFVSFLGVLLALRLIPAVVRHILPFSEQVQRIWYGRRQLAKRYDSYQWQKLLWIGLGLGCYIGLSGRLSGPPVALAAMCLVAGGAGLLCWRCTCRAQKPLPPASR